jgi:hypothetical protein
MKTNEEFLDKALDIQRNNTSQLKSALADLNKIKVVADDTAASLDGNLDKVKSVSSKVDSIDSELVMSQKRITTITKRLATNKIILAFCLIIMAAIIAIVATIIYKYKS